jgi:hypothetical protein
MMLKWLIKLFQNKQKSECNYSNQITWMWSETRNCNLYHCTKCSDWQTFNEFDKRHHIESRRT